jgi:hypothetical protein
MIGHLNVDLELTIINILGQFISLKGNDVFVMNTLQIWSLSYKTDPFSKPICFPETAKPDN